MALYFLRSPQKKSIWIRWNYYLSENLIILFFFLVVKVTYCCWLIAAIVILKSLSVTAISTNFFFFGMWISSFLSIICQKDCPFPMEWFLAPLLKIIWPCVCLSGLYSIPLGYLSVLTQMPHCFGYYSSVVNFENRKYEIVNVVLFQYCFCYLGFPEIPYEF